MNSCMAIRTPQPLQPITVVRSGYAGLGYLEGRECLRGRNLRYAALPQHEQVLMHIEEHRDLRDLYAAWMREIAAYPAKNKRVKKGHDLVDDETGWVVLAESIDKASEHGNPYARGIGFLVDPQDFVADGKRLVVVPKSIRIVAPFPQECIGKPDGKGFVVAMSGEERRFFTRLHIYSTRNLLRRDEETVRPVARTANSRIDIFTYLKPSEQLGIGGVPLSEKIME